ncbi:hypothetical protein IKE72_00805 [Candidatus Saccharibacteria bacterium]|nr:hypothetical protein [Candidatus Saccharibacteria bacterium]
MTSLKKKFRRQKRLQALENLRNLIRQEEAELSMDQFNERRKIADNARFTFKPDNFHPTVDQKLF